MKSSDYNNYYQYFLPGKSCESIYNKNKGYHNSPAFYWITSKVFCGMNYSKLSCENIYMSYPATQNKSGYYCIKGKMTFSGHIAT